jgi:hypothetical protein
MGKLLQIVGYALKQVLYMIQFLPWPRLMGAEISRNQE